MGAYMKTVRLLEKQGILFWIVMGVLALGMVGFIDYRTGPELSFSLFYFFPITLISWFTNYKLGIVTAVASAAVWALVDILSGASYSLTVIYFWNTLIRLGFFLLMVFSLELGKNLNNEKALARTDFTTNAANGRFFHTMLGREIARSTRYHSPFTVAYMDIDDFKFINDSFGHTAGDDLLCKVVECLEKNLRKTDLVARLGGDEFAILLPEVGLDAAQATLLKIQSKLLEKMQEHGWSVTFSIGVVTFLEPPNTVDEAISMADRAMYSVKNSGKNNANYIIHNSLPVQNINEPSS
jgi:diguanylate cyclase (GGDEF)-like protein